MVNAHARAPIQRLLAPRGPAAVAGRVGAVVVYAFQRMLWRVTRTHVGIERFDRQPATADADTPSAVVIEALASRVGAASPHIEPNLIFRFVGESVNPVRGAIHLPSFAAAGLDVSCSEISAGDYLSPSADAQTSPQHRTSQSSGFLRDGQVPESHSNHAQLYGL